MKTKSIIYTLLCGMMLFTLSCSKDDDNGGAEPEPENRTPEDFELVSAPDGATDVDLKPLFIWKEAEDPDGDEVTYNLFLGKNPSSLTEIASDISGTDYTPEDKLDLTTDYFWYVLASDGNGGETKSKTFSFTTRKLNDAVQASASAGFFGSTEIHTTVFDGKLWAIGGNLGNTPSTETWYTTDGVSWINGPNLPAPRYYHEVLTYDGKMWVLFGHNGNNLPDAIYASSDGLTWNLEGNSSSLQRYDHTALVFDDKMWIIGGTDSSNSADYKNDVWYSTDGANWTEATSNAAFSPRRGHSSVVYDGKMWVIGGQDASGYLNDVWHSTDGINWVYSVSYPPTFSTRGQHVSMVYGGKMWVISGDDGGATELNDVWASADGHNWIEVYTSAAFTPRRYAAGAVFDEKIWIIGGYDTGYVDDVWYME